MDVRWEVYKSKKILIVDYRGIVLDSDMIKHLNKALLILKKVDKCEKLRYLTDISGCYATPGFIASAKQADKELHVSYQMKPAIVGIKGAKEILLKAYNIEAKVKMLSFNTIEEAMDYLAED